MICSVCGRPLINGSAMICEHCGASLRGPAGASAPAPSYTTPTPGYTPPAPGYTPPTPGYTPPAPGYTPPAPGYTPPAPGYTPPAPGYTPPAPGYTPPAPSYTPPAPAPRMPVPAAGGPSVVVKTGGFGWLKVVIPLVVLAVAAVVSFFVFFSPSDEDKIRDRIDTFNTAIEEGDVRGIVGCFDKKTQSMYDAMLGITESVLGAVTDIDLPLGDMIDAFGLPEGMIDGSLTVQSIEIVDDKTANVEVCLYYEGEEEYGTIVMCKEDNDWYIDLEETTGESLSIY